jgi:hypothetical protein
MPMKKNDGEVTADLRERTMNNESKMLFACVKKYFRGKSDSLIYKEPVPSMVAALAVYFQDKVKP